MAPALTEPLSPKEKLSDSTATATPATRSSKKLESAVADSASSSPTPATGTKERKSRTVVTPTTSTRVTRSKDNTGSQRISEKIALASPAAQSPTEDTTEGATSASAPTAASQEQNCKSSNDQMGLSAALSNNNNNTSKEASSSPALDQQTLEGQKPTDNSTEQLLADLTSDFEEVITAEVCLRKQLLDVNLTKETSRETTASERKDILIIKDTCSGAASAATSSTQQSEEQHMDSQTNVGEETQQNVLKEGEEKQAAQQIVDTENKPDNPDIQTDVLETTKRKDDLVSQPASVNQAASSTNEDVEVVASIADVELQKLEEQPTCSGTARSQLQAVEELPPINTDSTMTASEVEDNLEERLSQLDGGIITDANTSVESQMPLATADTHKPSQLQTQSHVLLSPPSTTTLTQQGTMQQTSPLQLQHQQPYTPQSISSTSSGNMQQQSYLKDANTAEFEDQDIEEVLKALKGFEGAAGTDALCDFNVLFNEFTLNNYEEINSNQQPMNNNSSSTSSKPNSPLKDGQAEVEKKQQLITRKIDFMLRRMRKLQSRYMCKHASTEISGLFEWSVRVSSRSANPVRSAQMSEQEENIMAVVSGRPPIQFWQEQKKNPIPSAQMCAILRQLETSANAQQLCTAPSTSSGHGTTFSSISPYANLKKSRKALQENVASTTGGGAAASVTTAMNPLLGGSGASNERKGDEVVPIYDKHVSNEITHVSGLLQTEMREVQNAIDSDATESSSGGESADEMVSYNNQHQQPLSISKRAVWRYSRDRAAIAERWSWLLSQVTDLEIKIRQHNDLYHEMTRSNGPVVLEVAGGGTKTLENIASTSVNGYKNTITDETEADMSCCRTRAFVAKEFRKRKLFQTTNMHTISKKAARPSNIKCGCQWPQLPCTLCTGRADPTALRDLPDTMMMSNRVALLDAGYHPVLSFPEDICQSIHFESIGRLSDWQYRVMRCQAKQIVKNLWKAERDAIASSGGGGGHSTSRKNGGGDNMTKRRYIKKKDRYLAEKNIAAAAKGIAMATATTGTIAIESGNELTKNLKRPNCQSTGDVVHMPTTTQTAQLAANNSSKCNRSQLNNSSLVHQTSEYPLQNFDQYNHNQTHSSSISNSKCKNRKSLNNLSLQRSTHQLNNYNNNNNNNNNQSNNNTYNGMHVKGNSGSCHNNDNCDTGLSVRSRNSSPAHSASNYYKYDRALDRKQCDSYDIDNIVIPYSVAATTRIEILPYKEIPTPQWSIIDTNFVENRKTGKSKRPKEHFKAKIIKNGVISGSKIAASSTAETLIKNSHRVESKKRTGTDDAIKPSLAIVQKKNGALSHSGNTDNNSKDRSNRPNKIPIKKNNSTSTVNKENNTTDHGATKTANDEAINKHDQQNTLAKKNKILAKNVINGVIIKGSVKQPKEASKEEAKLIATRDLIKLKSAIDLSADEPQVKKTKMDNDNVAVTMDKLKDRQGGCKEHDDNKSNKLGVVSTMDKINSFAPNPGKILTRTLIVDTVLKSVPEATSKIVAETTTTTKANAETKITIMKADIETTSNVDVNTRTTKVDVSAATTTKVDVSATTTKVDVSARRTKVDVSTTTTKIDVAATTTKVGVEPITTKTSVLTTTKTNVETTKCTDLETTTTDVEKTITKTGVPATTTRKTDAKATTKNAVTKRSSVIRTKTSFGSKTSTTSSTAKKSTSKMEPPPLPPPSSTTAIAAFTPHLNENVGSDEDIEDISDETMMQRHARALLEERRKFQAYIKLSLSTRSRANRRSDSRAESSGTNTPDPASPAPHTAIIGAGDNESIPSPLALVNNNPLDMISEKGQAKALPPPPPNGCKFNVLNGNVKRQDRRRTTSSKIMEHELRDLSPDSRETVPPFEPLEFPLSDEVYQSMLSVMSDENKNNSKYIDDCQNSGNNSFNNNNNNNNSNIKTINGGRSRNGLKNETAASATKRNSKSNLTNCDANSRRKRRRRSTKLNNSNAQRKNSDFSVCSGGGAESISGGGSGGRSRVLDNNDGDEADSNSQNDIVDDDDDDEAIFDDLEDDYPKHHLAPDDIDDDAFYNDSGGGAHIDVGRVGIAAIGHDRYSDEYGAYVGHSLLDGDSESSGTEPFQDDDPNDPEWKGASRERTEKLRKKS